MRSLSALALAAGLLAAGFPVAAKDDPAFPRTKSYGRATVQYQDDQVKAVAAYDYSQRNHESQWLLVQVGVAMRDQTLVKRDNLRLTAPDGREIPLASQEEFVADSASLVKFRQNAQIFLRQLGSYFPLSARRDDLRFFALPGDGIIRSEGVILAAHAVVIGDVYFKSATAAWSPGTYRLVFDHERGRAELPIRLE